MGLGFFALGLPLIGEIAVNAVLIIWAVVALLLLAAPFLFFPFFAAVTHPLECTRVIVASNDPIAMETLLERIRRAELDCMHGHFPRGTRVLEIGGGSGFQASLLAERGCEVTSIDVLRPDTRTLRYGRQYYPVSIYDGSHLSFPDANFDVVFSSHALYHARPLGSMLTEIRRVLRPEGSMVLILPSSSWRMYTSLAHYPDLVRKVVARFVCLCVRNNAETGAPARGAQRVRLRDVLMNQPISPAPNIIAEWRLFRRVRWRRAFAHAGFEVSVLQSGPLFYTGQLFAPGLPFQLREAMARILGASSFVCTAMGWWLARLRELPFWMQAARTACMRLKGWRTITFTRWA
jgi:SAM-dependent methyltransferase